MNAVLTVGTFSDFSCATRPFATAGTVICLGSLASIFLCFKIIMRSRKRAYQGLASLRWVFLAGVGLSVLFSIVPFVSASLTSASIEGDEMVVRGCKQGNMYELRSPLAQMKSRLDHNKGGAFVRVYSPDDRIRVSIPLKGDSLHLKAIATAAPDATHQYVEQLKSQNKKIPPALQFLAN